MPVLRGMRDVRVWRNLFNFAICLETMWSETKQILAVYFIQEGKEEVNQKLVRNPRGSTVTPHCPTAKGRLWAGAYGHAVGASVPECCAHVVPGTPCRRRARRACRQAPVGLGHGMAGIQAGRLVRALGSLDSRPLRERAARSVTTRRDIAIQLGNRSRNGFWGTSLSL